MSPLPRLMGAAPFGPARPPGSKSVTNRVLLLAAMASETSRIHNVAPSEDALAMEGALRSLGVSIAALGDTRVVSTGAVWANEPIHVGASGTTLRFLVPWLATTLSSPVELRGAVRLFDRPMAGLLDALAPLGVRWEAGRGGARLVPARPLPERLDVRVDASASSQFVTGLALAAAALPGGGHLRFGGVPSRSYLDLTRHWLAAFGVDVNDGVDWLIPGAALRSAEVTVPGDWSGAAALLAAGAVGARTAQVGPLDSADDQGDRAILAILSAAGAHVEVEADQVRVTGPLRRGIDADLELCPDLAPVLIGLATCAPGPSELRGLRTLRVKECDRLDASAELVRWCGGRADVLGDHTIRVTPGSAALERAPFDPRADHRMAFAAAVAGLRHGGALLDRDCVAKTFPTFWEVWTEMLRQG